MLQKGISLIGIVVTAPLWVPTYVGITVMRYVMGKDQSNDSA